MNGKPLTAIKENAQVVFAISVHNNKNDAEQKFLTVVELRDSEGLTRAISWQSGVAKANESTRVEFSLLQERAGCYELRVFIMSDLVNPATISIESHELLVTGAEDVITGQFQITQGGKAGVYVLNEAGAPVFERGNHTIDFDASGRFELVQGCHLDLIPNNSTLAVKLNGEIVSVQTYEPVFITDNNYYNWGYSFQAEEGEYFITVDAYIEQPLTSVRSDDASSFRIAGGRIISSELSVDESKGYIRFIPDLG